MCGIVAQFTYRGDELVDPERLALVRDAMAARGPDGAGEWLSADRRVGLAHRRLAIIDPSPAGAQPMRGAEGALAIVFNGEIYNHRRLRSDLEAAGLRFRTASDTEVLLALYERKGAAMLDDLRGMYALAIWDGRRRELFLARDPLGIKPLYFADDGRTIRAASQVKALLAGGGVDTAPEPAGHAGYFLWGHVPEPYTMYRGIRQVPAGCSLTVREGGAVRVERFADVGEALAGALAEGRRERAGAAEWEAGGGAGGSTTRLRQALLDAVRVHLIADVPVGVFLSAGVDSASVAALAAEAGGCLESLTLGFAQYRGTPSDETVLAAEVARRYGLRHRTVWVEQREFEEDFERILAAMDQPTTDAVNTWFVGKAAAAAGWKVALSGLGGDELFGGYPSFAQVPRSVRALGLARGVPGAGRALRRLAAPWLGRVTSPKYAGLAEYGGRWGGAYLLRRALFMPWEIAAEIGPELAQRGLEQLGTLEALERAAAAQPDGFHKVAALESAWYMRDRLLRDTDWAAMAHSLEVRVPLADLRLAREVWRIAGREGRPPRKAALAAATSSPLPREVLARPKTGFLAPVGEWLSAARGSAGGRGLRDWARVVYRESGGAAAGGLR